METAFLKTQNQKVKTNNAYRYKNNKKSIHCGKASLPAKT